ncbi:hypothetical protein OJ962_11525, partial [Solirubrobacter sp. CPCC 204708]
PTPAPAPAAPAASSPPDTEAPTPAPAPAAASSSPPASAPSSPRAEASSPPAAPSSPPAAALSPPPAEAPTPAAAATPAPPDASSSPPAPPSDGAPEHRYGSPPPARNVAPAYGVSASADDPRYESPPFIDPGAPPAAGEEPLRGRTAVEITAEVDGQPIQVRTTLPGAGNVAPEEAQQVADDAAAAVARDLATEADPTPAVAAVALVEPDVPAPAPSLGVSVDIGEHWQAVVSSLREGTPMLAAALDDCSPVPEGEDGLTLLWPEESAFLKKKAEAPANKDALVQAIRAVTGSSLRLAYELRAAGAPTPAAAALAAAPTLSDEDLVKRFMDEFDAELLPDEPEET